MQVIGELSVNDECHDAVLAVQNGAVVPLMLALLVPASDRFTQEYCTLTLAKLTQHSLGRLLLNDYGGYRQITRSITHWDPDVMYNSLLIWRNLLSESTLLESLSVNKLLEVCKESTISKIQQIRSIAYEILALAAQTKTNRDYLLNLKMLDELKVSLVEESKGKKDEECLLVVSRLYEEKLVQRDFEDSGIMHYVLQLLDKVIKSQGKLDNMVLYGIRIMGRLGEGFWTGHSNYGLWMTKLQPKLLQISLKDTV